MEKTLFFQNIIKILIAIFAKNSTMKVSNLCVAVIQSDLKWEDVDSNLHHFSNTINSLQKEYHIVLLPEMFTTGFSMNARKLAEPVNGKTTKWMLSLSKSKNFAIGGSIILKDGDNYYNRFLLVTPEGEIHEYNKRHLFSLGNEHIEYSPGTKRVTINYLGWRILPQICYDLRFPVWSRNRNDYDLLINVANFPGSRRDVWNTLLKARALENQCFVAAANRVGSDGMGIIYTGDSQLIDARGKIVAQLEPNKEGVITACFSIDELYDFRKKFPILPDADNFEIIV